MRLAHLCAPIVWALVTMDQYREVGNMGAAMNVDTSRAGYRLEMGPALRWLMDELEADNKVRRFELNRVPPSTDAWPRMVEATMQRLEVAYAQCVLENTGVDEL